VPNCDSTEEYRSNFLDILCAVGEIIGQQQNAQVVLRGDFNVVFCDTNSSYRMLREFCDEYKISSMPLYPSSPTVYSYCQETLQHYSFIDYFCASVDMVPDVLRVSTIDAGNNLSDHLPVECISRLPKLLSYCRNSVNNAKGNDVYQLRWDKANLHDYDNGTYCYLNTIGLSYAHAFQNCPINCTCGKTWLIDEYHKKVLATALALSIPRRKVEFYKYWWDQELDEFKTKSNESHQLWVAAVRPMSGDLYDRKRTCKAQYRRGLRYRQRDACCEVSNELHECLMQKDNTGFRKCWNSKFKRQKAVHRSW